MEHLPVDQSLVPYGGQEITRNTILRTFNKLTTKEARYREQVRIREEMLRNRRRNDEVIEYFCEFVDNDRAWEVDRDHYHRDWSEVMTVAQESKDRRASMNSTRNKILETWGAEAEEWVEKHGTRYGLDTIRTASIRYPQLAQVKELLRPIVMNRIRNAKREWTCDALPADFDKVSKGKKMSPVTDQDLSEFDLYIDHSGILRRQSEAPQGRVLGIIPQEDNPGADFPFGDSDPSPEWTADSVRYTH